MVVEAKITNKGGLEGSQDVTFDYTGPQSGSDTKADVVLESGESTTVSFSVPAGDIESTPPKYTLEVRTENDSKDVDIVFGSPAELRTQPSTLTCPRTPAHARTRRRMSPSRTLEG